MQQTWRVDSLDRIAGWPLGLLGTPGLLRTERGLAVRFGGADGLVVPTHPLAGALTFTAEVVFRPEMGGQAEQRFLHMQSAASDDRILFETRLTANGHWFLDTFILSGQHRQALYAQQHLHRLDRWYHAALVYDGREMRHYVDGVHEMTAKVPFAPQAAGSTALGMRMNRVYHFRGAILLARFSDDALLPDAFLPIP